MTTSTTSQLITWNDQYSVGIAAIDAQHQKWIRIINEVHDAMLNQKTAATLGKSLDAMLEYTGIHFAAEEALMRRHAYPDYAAHKTQHDKLLVDLKELQQSFRSGKLALSIKVMSV